jgi:hypothetical protein
MRPAFLAHLAVVAVLFVAVGCSSNKGKIESTTWTSTATTVQGEEIPEGARRLQFGKDGHLFYTIAGKLYKGNYSLGMGPAVTFTMDEDLEGRKIHALKIVIDGDQLKLTNADGRTLMFQKVN